MSREGALIEGQMDTIMTRHVDRLIKSFGYEDRVAVIASGLRLLICAHEADKVFLIKDGVKRQVILR